MTKQEQKRDITQFNKNFQKIAQHDIDKDINDVYEDTKYSNV